MDGTVGLWGDGGKDSGEFQGVKKRRLGGQDLCDIDDDDGIYLNELNEGNV